MLPKINLMLFTASILLVVAQFVLANELAAVGDEVGKMELQTGFTLRENENIDRQIAVSESLENIALKAKDLGFIKNVSYLSVAADQPVAFK